ncbi:toxin ParE1 [Betaproteobacteria bacterium]|nr:toxin ParE1 [Betaproteobacteria bacterium]
MASKYAQSFRLSRRAIADLEHIWAYTLKNWSAHQADHYCQNLLAALEDMGKGKRKGVACDEVRKGYFKYATGRHLVFFRQSESCPVEVIRILHQSMDVKRHMSATH